MASTFRQYWNRLCSVTTALNADETKMTISVASFRKQLEKAYGQGAQDQKELTSELDAEKRKRNPLGSIFPFVGD